MKRRPDSCHRLPRWGGVCALVAVGCGCGEAASPSPSPAASYAEARAVIDTHCVSCHSEQPTISAFPIAPSGVIFDTPEQMQQYAERIRLRTNDGTMPLLNKTGMTEHERAVLGRWAEGGARGPTAP